MSRPVVSFSRTLARALRRATLVLAAVSVAGGSACSDSTDPGAAPVAEVALSDTTIELRLGDEAALVARPRQSGGDELVGRRIFWSSRDPQVVEVSQAGVLRALALGTTQVAASAEGRAATATVTVLPRAIATVQIDPATLQLVVNGRQRLVARTFNDAGAPAAAPVTWTTLSPGVVSISADGEVTALSPGVGSVRASAGGVTATAAIVVTPVPVARITITPSAPSVVVGGTLQLEATTADAGGAPLPGRVVSWSSRNAGVAVVSSTGQVTGLAAGTAEIVASAEGQSAVATVTVTPVVAARVIITPDGSSVGVGGTLQLGATVVDAAGNALPGRPVTFTSRDPGIATVTSTGLVTGVAGGTATITATSDGASGSATVRVVASGNVATVAVDPPAATLVVGQTRQLTATARTADGNTVNGRPVTWSSASPGVVTVSSTGVVTAVSPGTAQVLAQIDGITGTSTITVQRVPVAAVQVTPSPATVATGSAVQLQATPRDASGNALAGRTVTWSSDNSGIATVTSDGRVLGVAPGTTTVRATSEGVTGTATVTVTAVVRVSPEAVAIRDRGNINRTAQLVATDAAGNVLPADQVTWQSADPSIATVDGNGVVRGQSSGSTGTATTTITASYRGATATATVTVTRN